LATLYPTCGCWLHSTQPAVVGYTLQPAVVGYTLQPAVVGGGG